MMTNNYKFTKYMFFNKTLTILINKVNSHLTINLTLLGRQYSSSSNIIKSVVPVTNRKRIYFLPTLNPTMKEYIYPDFFTFDIECYVHSSGSHVPYLAGFYHPDFDYQSFSGVDCVLKALNFLFDFPIPRGSTIDVWAHNGGKYDALMIIAALIKTLPTPKNVKCLQMADGSLFYFEFSYREVTWRFKDSFKLMPVKLDTLLKDFNISSLKLPIDHESVSVTSLNTLTEVPPWLTNRVDLQEIVNQCMISGKFSLSLYVVHYNRADCVGLHELIKEFFYAINRLFNFDATKCLTISMISMNIFRTSYLPENTISLLNKTEYNLIKKAYFGGIVSVYKPYATKAYYYDVNSMYPAAMLRPIPVGKPSLFEGDSLEELFGFAFCEVKCPDTLFIPFLPIRITIDGHERVVSPKGCFKGWWFSEELKYAKSLGYEIKIIRGIQFKQSKTLFTEFVKTFYDLRKNSNPSLSAIGKLILNSLYGRFGIERDHPTTIITRTAEIRSAIENFFTKVRPTNIRGSNAWLYKFDTQPSDRLASVDIKLYNLLKNQADLAELNKYGNVAIAAAVTAYGRVEIDQFKRLVGEENVIYSDTDSLISSVPLPREVLGSGLGEMKNEIGGKHPNYRVDDDHEWYIDEFIALGDKAYAYTTTIDGEKRYMVKLKGARIDKSQYEVFFRKFLDTYHNGGTITVRNTIFNRDLENMVITTRSIDKRFKFPYLKRIKVFNNEGLWISTLPVEAQLVKSLLKPGFYLRPQPEGELMERSSPVLIYDSVRNGEKRTYQAPFMIYSQSVNLTLASIDELLTSLQALLNRAVEDGLLVVGVDFLIQEVYRDRTNSVCSLNPFKSVEGVMKAYSNILNYRLEYYEPDTYLIDEIVLLIRIPDMVNLYIKGCNTIQPGYRMTEYRENPYPLLDVSMIDQNDSQEQVISTLLLPGKDLINLLGP